MCESLRHVGHNEQLAGEPSIAARRRRLFAFDTGFLDDRPPAQDVGGISGGKFVGRRTGS
jgi:hypothetical protein